MRSQFGRLQGQSIELSAGGLQDVSPKQTEMSRITETRRLRNSTHVYSRSCLDCRTISQRSSKTNQYHSIGTIAARNALQQTTPARRWRARLLASGIRRLLGMTRGRLTRHSSSRSNSAQSTKRLQEPRGPLHVTDFRRPLCGSGGSFICILPSRTGVIDTVGQRRSLGRSGSAALRRGRCLISP